MPNSDLTYYHINHKYREKIVVPYLAIQNNIDFLSDNGEKRIIFADGIKAKVLSIEEKNICSLKEEIESLYKMSQWDFICKWDKVYNHIDSMYFLVIKVRKEG